MDIGVVGAGSWGTALARTLADGGHRVDLWARDAALVEAMRAARENTRYLPGAKFAETLAVTADLDAAVAGKRMVVAVVPSQVTRQVIGAAARAIARDAL